MFPIINYAESTSSNNLILYTEIEHDFNIGDRVFITGGHYSNYVNLNTIITNQSTIINFSDLNGYEIIDIKNDVQSETGKYGVVLNINIGNNNPIYPYGTVTNRLGRKDTDNDAFNHNVPNTNYRKIYITKSAQLHTHIAASTVENTVNGFNDHDYAANNYKVSCINSTINNSTILKERSNKTEYISNKNNKDIIEVDEVVIGTPERYTINKLSKYIYATNIEHLNAHTAKINYCNFYHNFSKTEITNSTITNSVIGTNDTIDHIHDFKINILSDSSKLLPEKNTITNSRINNIAIGDKSSPIYSNLNTITKSEITNVFVISPNSGTVNFLIGSGSSAFDILIMQIPTKVAATLYHFTDTEYEYNGIIYAPTNWTDTFEYNYMNDVYYKTKYMPTKVVDITIKLDQTSPTSEIELKFDKPFLNGNVAFSNGDSFSDYFSIGDLFLYPTSNVSNPSFSPVTAVEISNSVKFNGIIGDTSYVHNNNKIEAILANGDDYPVRLLKNNYNSNKYNQSKLLSNSIFYNVENTKYLVSYKMNYTHIKNISELYINYINNSYIDSTNPNDISIMHANDNLLPTKKYISNTIGHNAFLYDCTLVNSKFINTSWTNCRILTDITRTNDSSIYPVDNSELQLISTDSPEFYIDKPKSYIHSLPFRNPVTSLPQFAYEDPISENELDYLTFNDLATISDYTDFIAKLVNNRRVSSSPFTFSNLYKKHSYYKINKYVNVAEENVKTDTSSLVKSYNSRIKYNVNDSTTNNPLNYIDPPLSLIPTELNNNIAQKTSIITKTKQISNGDYSFFPNNINELEKILTKTTNTYTNNNEYDIKNNAALNTAYSYNLPSIFAGDNPPGIDINNEVEPYGVDKTFIIIKDKTSHPELNGDVQLYSKNIINTKIDNKYIIVGQLNRNSTIDEKKFVDITSTTSGPGNILDNTSILTNVEFDYNSQVVSVAPLSTGNINIGTNKIKITLNNIPYTAYDPLLAVYVPNMIYELESVIIKKQNEPKGEEYMLRQNLTNTSYNYNDEYIKYSSFGVSNFVSYLLYDENVYFEYKFLPNVTYDVYFNIWVTPLQKIDENVMDSFLTSGYNDYLYTGIGGGYSYKVRTSVRVTSNITTHYLLNNNNNYILTEGGEKIKLV